VIVLAAILFLQVFVVQSLLQMAAQLQ